MNKILIYWLLKFLLFLIILDFGVGLFNSRNFDKISYGIYGLINRTFSSDYEILIVGSSTAQSHYDPQIIENKTSKKTYNAGIGGYGLLLNYAIIKESINHNMPQIIILDIAPNVIVDPLQIDKLEKLLPYYNKYESFREIIDLNKKHNLWFILSKSVQYNSTLYNEFRSINKKKITEIDGYHPIIKQKLDSLNNKIFATEFNEDTIQMEYFNKIISICMEHGIDLYVFVSPSYIPFDPDNKIVDRYKSICITSDIKFYNYSQDLEFALNSEKFADQIHLNQNGATTYSNLIAKLILEEPSFQSTFGE